MKNFEIPLFLDADALHWRGIQAYVPWNPTRQPHLVFCGNTASGKTYALKVLLGRIATRLPDAEVFLCDYKHDDFRFLDGAPRYYAFDACRNGLNAFYDAFRSRQSGEDPSRAFRLFVFDEWAAYVAMLDRKEAEKAKQQLATLLMLARSFNCHVLVSQQRCDSAYFATARDNFNVVTMLGTCSKESREMFFSNFREELKPVQQLGEGYMLVNGATLHHIQVPVVRDTAKLDAAIRRLVS